MSEGKSRKTSKKKLEDLLDVWQLEEWLLDIHIVARREAARCIAARRVAAGCIAARRVAAGYCVAASRVAAGYV